MPVCRLIRNLDPAVRIAVLAAVIGVIAIVYAGSPEAQKVPSDSSTNLRLISSDPSLIHVEFTFSAPTVVANPREGVRYHDVRVEGGYSADEPGKPDVPVVTRYVAVPDCDDVTVEIVSSQVHDANRVNVRPCPEYVDRGRGYPDAEFRKDESIYSLDAEYPETPFVVSSVQYMRKQALVRIDLRPVRFNPVQQRLNVVDRLELKIRPIGSRGPVRVPVGPMQSVLTQIAGSPVTGPAGVSAGGTGMASSSSPGSVCWCNTADDGPLGAFAYVRDNCAADYLMLVADELLVDGADSSLVAQLAQRRADFNGFNVAIVRMGQLDSTPAISGTAFTIRDFIKSVYDSETAGHMGDQLLGYVLLLGDAYNPAGDALIPTVYSNAATPLLVATDQANGSDTYYTLLSGTPFGQDWVPDVLLGRLPVDSDGSDWELANVVSKIINFEPLPLSFSWADSIILASGGSDNGFTFAGQGAVGFRAYFDEIVATSIPASYVVSQYHRMSTTESYTDDSFSDLLASEIGKGCRLVGIFDHANPVAFEKAFFPKHYDTLRATAGTPVVFSMGSNSGFFDLTPEVAAVWPPSEPTCCPGPRFLGLPCQAPSTPLDSCDALTERLLLQPNGAVGVIAYSRSAQAIHTQRAFANFYAAVFQFNNSQLAQALVATKLSTHDDRTTRNLNLLGDPALNVMWRMNGQVSDSVDVAVRRSGLGFPTAVDDYGDTDVAHQVRIAVENAWKDTAYNVEVEAWDGVPDFVGSLLLSTTTVDSVVGHESVAVALALGQLSSGRHDVYVRLDPNNLVPDVLRSNNQTFRTIRMAQYQTGFPLKLPGVARDDVMLADVDPSVPGDEVQLQSSTNVSEMRCYSGNGVLRWTNNLAQAGHTPVVGNLHKGEGAQLVRIGPVIAGATIVYILDGKDASTVATLLLPFSSAPFVDRKQVMTVAPYHGSDSLQVLLYAQEFFDNRIYSFLPNGDVNWVATLGSGSAQSFAMSAADLDGDGRVEVAYTITTSAGDSVGVIGDAGETIWTSGLGNAQARPKRIQVVDLNLDGALEILTNSKDTSLGEKHSIHVIRGNGSPDWSVNFDDPLPGRHGGAKVLHFATGDLDCDGAREIVYVYGNVIGVIDSVGNVVRTDTLGIDSVFVHTPLLADINGDACPELVTLNLAWHPLFNEYELELRVYDSALVEQMSPITFRDWGGIVSNLTVSIAMPALGDVDGDGTLEVALATSDSVLHVITLGPTLGKPDWGQRLGDPMHSNLFEQPISGSYDSKVSLFNRTRVVGDAVFNKPVYVDRSATVVLSSTDAQQQGDPDRVELRFNDDVTIDGAVADTVYFRVDPLAPDAATWGGIAINDSSPSGPAQVEYVVFLDTEIALECSTATDVFHSRVSGAASIGIRASDDLLLSDVIVESSGGTGVFVGAGALADLRDVRLSDNGGSGFECDTCATGSVIRRSTLRDNVIDGISLTWTSSVTIDSCTISGNQTGIHCQEAVPAISECTIDNNNVGITAVSSSNPTVTLSSISGNGTGVVAWDDSYPVLGITGSGDGHNCIQNSTSYHISNLSDPGPGTWANYNYWGHRCCPASKFLGNILCTPSTCDSGPQCSGPPLMVIAPGTGGTDGPLPERFSLERAGANPFNPSTVMRYTIPVPGYRTTISIYNVKGQKVVDLVDEFQAPGSYLAKWAGHNQRGQSVASGVYFLRMRAGSFSRTMKLTLIK